MGGGKEGKFPIGRTPSDRVLIRNLASMLSSYGATDGGRLAGQGQSKNRNVRNWRTSDPKGEALTMFQRATKGARVISKSNGDVRYAYFKGATVTYRKVSSSPDRSSAVDIVFRKRVSGYPKKQRIHHVRGES